jgi:hypothetical protein
VLSLQEIIHETKAKKLGKVFLMPDFEKKAFDRANWSLFSEVLLRMGFESRWVHRAMGLVPRGQAAITTNGEVGIYFPSSRGVR